MVVAAAAAVAVAVQGAAAEAAGVAVGVVAAGAAASSEKGRRSSSSNSTSRSCCKKRDLLQTSLRTPTKFVSYEESSAWSSGDQTGGQDRSESTERAPGRPPFVKMGLGRRRILSEISHLPGRRRILNKPANTPSFQL